MFCTQHDRFLLIALTCSIPNFNKKRDKNVKKKKMRKCTECPKKSVILGKMPIKGLERGLKIKVWGVLKNSGNFQSNEHRNFVFSSKND